MKKTIVAAPASDPGNGNGNGRRHAKVTISLALDLTDDKCLRTVASLRQLAKSPTSGVTMDKNGNFRIG